MSLCRTMWRTPSTATTGEPLRVAAASAAYWHTIVTQPDKVRCTDRPNNGRNTSEQVIGAVKCLRARCDKLHA